MTPKRSTRATIDTPAEILAEEPQPFVVAQRREWVSCDEEGLEGFQIYLRTGITNAEQDELVRAHAYLATEYTEEWNKQKPDERDMAQSPRQREKELLAPYIENWNARARQRDGQDREDPATGRSRRIRLRPDYGRHGFVDDARRSLWIHHDGKSSEAEGEIESYWRYSRGGSKTGLEPRAAPADLIYALRVKIDRLSPAEYDAMAFWTYERILIAQNAWSRAQAEFPRTEAIESAHGYGQPLMEGSGPQFVDDD